MTSLEILFVLGVVGMAAGLFLLVFKRGRRLAGLGVLAASLILSGYGAHQITEQTAQEAGFATYADYKAATAPQPSPVRKTQEGQPTPAQRLADLQAAFYAPPADQLAFLAAIDHAADRHDTALNGLVKGGFRQDRATALCAAVADGRAAGWVGTIDQLTTNGDGFGVVTLRLSERTTLGTMNNALSDLAVKTMIAPTAPLFKTLSTLKEGDTVRFTADLLPDPLETDCFYEASMTMAGAMQRPDFVMRLHSVETFAPPAS